MNCLEFRRQTLIDPSDRKPAWVTHQESCASCRDFASKMARQDELTREAAMIDVPEGFAARILLNQSLQSQSRRPTRKYWLSLAASLFVIVPLVLSQFLSTSDPMDDAILAHIEHELMIKPGHGPIFNQAEVGQLLASHNVQLGGDIGQVVYAGNCVIDGKLVAHLVVNQGSHQYVLLLIPGDFGDDEFGNDRWHGQYASLSGRSLAVLSQDPNANIEQATASFHRQLSARQTI